MKKFNKGAIVIYIIFLIMAIEIIILTNQNKNLNNLLYQKGKRSGVGLNVGDKIADINDFLEGRFGFLSSPQNKLLLIFFSNHCPACEIDAHKWNKLLSIRNENLKILGISLSNEIDTFKFIKKHNLTLDVIIDSTHTITKNFFVSSIPAKILINEKSLVEFIDVGSSSKKYYKKLEEILTKNSG